MYISDERIAEITNQHLFDSSLEYRAIEMQKAIRQAVTEYGEAIADEADNGADVAREFGNERAAQALEDFAKQLRD